MKLSRICMSSVVEHASDRAVSVACRMTSRPPFSRLQAMALGSRSHSWRAASSRSFALTVDFWTSKLLNNKSHMHCDQKVVGLMGQTWHLMALSWQLAGRTGVLFYGPAAAPCCRKFTVTDVDLIFQKVRARLLAKGTAVRCHNTQLSTCNLPPGQDKGRTEDEL